MGSFCTSKPPVLAFSDPTFLRGHPAPPQPLATDAVPAAAAPFPVRLTLPHLLHLRAVAQGLPVADAARRYLGIEHGNEAPSAHRRVVDLAAAVARRRGDSRWRLLGVEIAAPGVEAAAPSLDDWARAEGLDGWSQAELRDLHAERFPPPEASRRRRVERNERLRARRLALIDELEAAAAERPAAGDRLDGWLAPELAGRLQRRGLATLGDLQALIARGGRWWADLPACGPIKAKRLSSHVEQLLGPRPSAWATSTVQADLAALSGRHGGNRMPTAAGIDAADDRQAVRAWIAARAGSALTAKQYEREAERFILWCVVERRRALADATADDCRAYMDFLADVPPRWISRAKAARFAPGWAPFRGPLGLASRGVAIAALHSLFSWLVQARYLASNPWALVNRKLGDDAARLDGDDDVTSRAFTPAAWRTLHAQLRGAPPSASAERLRWLLVFVECTGLRAAELLAARRGHLQRTSRGWVLRVHGKGRKNRTVPVPAAGVEATRTYFAGRGLDLDAAPPHAPLLGSLADAMAPLGYSALHETFVRFVRRAVEASDLPPDERRRAERASAHWLRHTHATRAAERQVPPDVLQENLGQSDPRTTARYYRAQIERRQREMERAFAPPQVDERP